MAAGDLVQALTVAAIIRVLVHETSGSKPVLKHLYPNYLALPIVEDQSQPTSNILGRVLLAQFNLPIGVTFSATAPHVRLQTGMDMAGNQAISLGHWWNKSFTNLPVVGRLTRRELILGMANKESAHVDSNLTEKYKSLLESQFLQVTIGDVNLGALNISRLLVGRAGVQVLWYLDNNLFKGEFAEIAAYGPPPGIP